MPERSESAQNKPPLIRRRSFLIGTGLTVLGVAGGAAIAGRTPEVEFASGSYGSTGPRVLVAYDSQFGSTGDIAVAIGQELSGQAQVDVRLLEQVAGLEDYDAIVFGAPVQRNVMKESATTWLRERRSDIAVPLAFFMPSASYGIDPDRESQTMLKNGLLEDAADLTGTSPVAMMPFGGLVDFSRMSFITSTVYQITSETSEQGDFRDFPAIRAWAGEIRPQLGL